MTSGEKLKIAYHCLARCDHFVTGFVKISEDYDNHAAIAKKDITGVSLKQYKRVISLFSGDMEDIMKRANGGAVISLAISIALDSPYKKQNVNDGNARGGMRNPNGNGNYQGNRPCVGNGNGQGGDNGPRYGHGNGQRGNNQGNGFGNVWISNGRNNQQANRNSAVGWDNDWGNGGGQANDIQRDPEESKKRDGLVCCPGFMNYLAGTLASNHCVAFAVKGLYCPQSANCNLKHLKINRWTPGERKTQIAHVERHKNSMKFIGGNWLP